MQVIVRYTEEGSTPLEEAFLQRIATETLKRSFFSQGEGRERVVLHAIALPAEKIQALNKEYRQKDAVTDILSFGEYEDTQALKRETKPEVFLGELFFCPEFIQTAAVEDEVTFSHELIYIFSHGVLHLLGYDHSEEMFGIQDAVTEQLVKEI